LNPTKRPSHRRHRQPTMTSPQVASASLPTLFSFRSSADITNLDHQRLRLRSRRGSGSGSARARLAGAASGQSTHQHQPAAGPPSMRQHPAAQPGPMSRPQPRHRRRLRGCAPQRWHLDIMVKATWAKKPLRSGARSQPLMILHSGIVYHCIGNRFA